MQASGATDARSSQAGTHRLFFALWPDDATRLAIATVAARLRAISPAGRWIPAARYHLTLQYLGTSGSAPLALIDAASAAAERVRTPGFPLTLDRLGSFRTRSYLWWLGCGLGAPLHRLSDELAKALASHGVPVSTSPLVPHVSLLRGAGRPPPVGAEVMPVQWPVSSIVLVHSHAGADAGSGQVYDLVGHWPLRPG